MEDDPIVLDAHRGMMAQKATEIRRHLAEVQAQQTTLRQRQAELEKFLLATPSVTWEDAAEKARYLITLLAATPEGRDPRRRKIIAGVLEDFERLAERGEASPGRSGPAKRRGRSTVERQGPKHRAESIGEKNEREVAGDKDRAASRKATKGSQGKRRRGGSVGSTTNKPNQP
jgi:hypothetical protein